MKLPYIIPEEETGPALVYNVTTKVAGSVADEWLLWMQKEYIPAMIATGCFEKAMILRLTEVDESEGPTFAVQYSANSRELYNQYIQSFADKLRAMEEDRWKDLTYSFRTVLRVVN